MQQIPTLRRLKKGRTNSIFCCYSCSSGANKPGATVSCPTWGGCVLAYAFTLPVVKSLHLLLYSLQKRLCPNLQFEQSLP